MRRRDFLAGSAWMGAAAIAGGCMSRRMPTGQAKIDFAVPPLKKVRVGVVGVGHRGPGAVHRLSMIPGVTVTAICDVRPEKAQEQAAWLKDKGKPEPRLYTDSAEAWKRLCESDEVDLVYNVTPWSLHAPIALYAMEHGKHVAIEVPAAMTVDECWALVETCERTGCHCMQLENCCYGEIEMLAQNLIDKGLLGTLVHGECAYIHDLRASMYTDPNDNGYYEYWRLKWNSTHKGNQYTTHGFGPMCWHFEINRGDRLDYLVSLESNPTNLAEYAGEHFPADSWQAKLRPEMGDMNTTLIKTAKGRSIMLQHDVASPRPYSRIGLVSGTKGIIADYPPRLSFAEKNPKRGSHGGWMNDKDFAEARAKYRHPLWKKAGEIAAKVGGHGGMDFLMDLRLAYCLQNGLPLDQSVYDLAAWCSIAELSEISARGGSCPQKIPDFTRGAWEKVRSLPNFDIDLAKMGISQGSTRKDESALNV